MNVLSQPAAATDVTDVRDQSGQALILAVIIMAVLVVGATAVASLMSSNQTTSGRERQAVRALSSGEAGLDLAANAVVAAEAGGTQSALSGHANTTTVDGNTGHMDRDEGGHDLDAQRDGRLPEREGHAGAARTRSSRRALPDSSRPLRSMATDS